MKNIAILILECFSWLKQKNSSREKKGRKGGREEEIKVLETVFLTFYFLY